MTLTFSVSIEIDHLHLFLLPSSVQQITLVQTAIIQSLVAIQTRSLKKYEYLTTN